MEEGGYTVPVSKSNDKNSKLSSRISQLRENTELSNYVDLRGFMRFCADLHGFTLVIRSSYYTRLTPITL